MKKHAPVPADIQDTVDTIMARSRARFGHGVWSMRLPAADELSNVREGHYPDRNERAAEAKRLRNQTWDHMQDLVNAKSDKAWRASDSREYDKAEAILNELDQIYADNYVDRSGVIAPAPSTEYREGVPLASDQSFAEYAAHMGHTEAPEGPLSLAKCLRGAFNGDWRGADQERNAMSGSSTSSGGALIPSTLAGVVIDLARAKARVLEAGAQVVPMDNRTVDVPRWVTQPAPDWRAENAPIREAEAAMDTVTLKAKSLACYVRVSRELVEDTKIQGELEAAFAASFALQLDAAALYGSGADKDGDSERDEPLGVKNTPGVSVTPLATNGATPTWAALVGAVGRLRDANEEPNAQIMADRTARSLALLTGSDGQYVTPPSYLEDVQRLTTGQVPLDLATGTGTNTSDVFTADWTKLLVGIRTNLIITPLTERFMPDAGQYAFVAWFRGDIAVARPTAFDVTTGVKA